MDRKKDYSPISRKLRIILAEDDPDDRLLFTEAIEELPVNVDLSTINNGDELMVWLAENKTPLPDLLFLDLNMPRKNGFAALSEIKRDASLEALPVIVFSTATNREMIKQVFKDAAHYYMRKPIHFWELKELIYKSLRLIADHETGLPGKQSFILTTD